MAEIQIIPDAAKAMFRRFLELREEADAMAEALKRKKEERDEAEQEAYAALAESVGNSAIPVDLGPPYGKVRFQPVATTYGNVLNENKLMDYLENSAQVEEFTRPALNKGELNKLARQLREGNESFPPGFDYYEKKYVRVTIPKGS